MPAMRPRTTDLKQALFLSMDLAGISTCISALYAPGHWQLFLFAVGPLLITAGLSAQLASAARRNGTREESILRHCGNAGIENIFPSRMQDPSAVAEAELAELSKSQSVSLLGVALRRMFDPSDETTEAFRKLLYEPTRNLKVAVLDPECQAAIAREEIECGNGTISDINHTLSNGLISCIAARLRILEERTPRLDLGDKRNREALLNLLNLQVRIYRSDPVAHVLRFDSSLFCEQYHSGRPEEIVLPGGCIGKYMPVIQYRKDSWGYRFMESHVENLWERSTDMTPTLISHALEMLSKAECKR